MKILIATGGTGGHLLPAQQLASFFLKEEICFAGHGLNHSPFFKRESVEFYEIPSASLKNPLRFLVTIAKSLLKSIRLLQTIHPDCVVGFGSFHSVPLLCAAVLLRKPIVLFEANCQLGKVNRLFAPFAKRIAMQFAPSSVRSNFSLVPLLPWTKRPAAKVPSEQFTILIFGGSQGAAFLNREIPSLLPLNVHVIHLTGKEELVPEVQKAYAGRNVIVKSFEPNMHDLYASADVAICRSGAGTIAELIRYELPALLIPFPQATNDHQRANAEFLAKKVEGATMIDQKEATPQRVREMIADLITRREQLRRNLYRFREESEGRTPLWQVIISSV